MTNFADPLLRALAPYVPGEQPRLKGVVKLNTNESPYPPAPGVLKAVQAAVEGMNRYPDLTAGLFLQQLSKETGVPQNLLMAVNGSDEALDFIFTAFAWRGVAFADETYGFYPVYAARRGIVPTIVPLREDFTLAVEDYDGYEGTVFIANPNAPTGLALAVSQIRGLLKRNPQMLLVVDEAYVDFGGESCLPLLQEFDNLLVVGTFSKSRQLAGTRIGWVAGCKELMDVLQTVRSSFNPYNVNSMSIAAGAAALQDKEYFITCRNAVVATREQTITRLRALGFTVTQSLANFVFASHLSFKADYLAQELKEQKILVRHFNRPRIQNWLRISVGSDDEMETLFAALRQIIKPGIQA
ncbi:MAG: pyridoxal phosphate-dependent aminotransferase [Oscillospiraceae bacterium]